MFLIPCPKCKEQANLDHALFKKDCFIVKCDTLIPKWHEQRGRYYQHVCNAVFGKSKQEVIDKWNNQ